MTEVIDKPQNGELARRESRMPIEIQDDSEFQNLLDSGRFEHLQRVATLFSHSQLVPEHFRGNVANCFIGLQMALRMRIDPLMLFQNSYVVHGRPGIEAKLAIALVNSSGLFTDSLDYEIDGGPEPMSANYRVRCFATRKTTGKMVHGPWVDWKMVKGEQWDTKQGSKWRTIPGLMFQYRAAMFFARLHCPERLMGMQTVDELRDMGGDDVVPPVTERGTKALLTKIRNASARPVSEGQQLVDPDTGEELQQAQPEPAQQLASHDFARPDAPADSPDPDVSGAEAEPPAEVAQEQSASAGMSENEKWFAAMIQLGESVELPQAKVLSGIAQWAKKNNLMAGKEHLAKSKDLRDLEASVREKRGWFAVV
jgi:hypothetical protein